MMSFYSDEQIREVRSIDLLTYLQSYEPTELIHIKGNTYCTREHDSLKISNGKWYWWSQGFGGNHFIREESMTVEKYMDEFFPLMNIT